MGTPDDNPLKAALDLHTPEPSEPRPDEGALTTGLQLATNAILRFRNLIVSFALLAAISVGAFTYLKDKPPALIWIVVAVAALCIGIAVWETALIVNSRRRDKMLKNWAVLPLPSFHDDYFRVGPYDTADKDRYRRPDGADKSVIAWVRTAQTPLLYLSGSSGTGKSSLINASLIPALAAGDPEKAQSPFIIVRVREFGDPLAQIRETLLKPEAIWKDQDKKRESVETAALLAFACQRLERDGKRLLVLFDQFEVLLIRHENRSEQTQALEQLFGAIRAEATTRYSNLTVLLSFRSDYDHLLKTLGLPGQNEDENSRKVSAFSRGAASNFLTDPASGLGLGGERVKAVLDEAEAIDGTRGLVRPIVLNMLGKLLQRLAGKDPGDVPRGALLADDIRRAVEEPRVLDYARPVLKDLIHNGIRVPRTIAETAAATGLATHLVEGCQRVLLDWPLVRCIGHNDQIGQSRWEIAHDFIARLLVPILETPRRSLLERARSVAAPVLLLCSVVVIAVYAINNPQNKRNEIFARLAQNCGIQAEEEDGTIRATASNRDKVTNITLALAAHLLRGLRQPIVLDLSQSLLLENVDGLKELKTLTALDLSLCLSLQNVDGLQDLKALTTLDLNNCTNLQNLNGLKGLRALTKLSFHHCDALQNVDGLKELKALTTLDLSRCENLQNVDGLKELKALTSLDLNNCYGLENVDGLKELKALTRLDLSHCSSLQNVDGLQDLKALTSLDLSFGVMENIERLVTSLPNLQHLDLRGTPIRDRSAILALEGKIKSLSIEDIDRDP